MDRGDFVVPSLALVGTTIAFTNLLYCCISTRRFRMIEQRLHMLEERLLATRNEEQEQGQIQPNPNSTVTTTTYATMPTYVQPNLYTYPYQPTASAPVVYYPQDPQAYPPSRNY
jgi:hypothetical protein